MSRQLKQICKVCHSPAIVTKTERVHSEISTLYCKCKNPNCGHSWASDLIYSHTLTKSKLDENGVIQYLLKKLPREELEKINEVIQQELNFA